MSEEKNIKQKLSREVFRANLFPLREKDEEQTMIASSGMRLLELYPRQNASGLLAKMLKALLTSKTAWCSDRSTMTWKAKVSKRKVLLYQLAVKVLSTNVSVSGSSAAMYPTPNATNINTPQSSRVERTKSGGFILRKKNKPHMTYGARLQDAMEFLEKPKAGGKLNPTFVEMLMGYPMNWTKIEPIELNHSETQSFHKSQEKSELQSLRLKMYPTPRANEPGRTTKGYGRGLAELLEGKKQMEPK